MGKPHVARSVLLVVVALGAIAVSLLHLPPFRYVNTTWCGYPARVGRWKHRAQPKELRVGWTTALGTDYAVAKELCARCHTDRAMSPEVRYVHWLWVRPQAETTGAELPLLSDTLRASCQELEGWVPVTMERDPHTGGPVLMVWPFPKEAGGAGH